MYVYTVVFQLWEWNVPMVAQYIAARIGAARPTGKVPMSDAPYSVAASRVFALCLCFRAAFAALTCTGFVPDEYFQTVEPAFHFVFGYGIRFAF